MEKNSFNNMKYNIRQIFIEILQTFFIGLVKQSYIKLVYKYTKNKLQIATIIPIWSSIQNGKEKLRIFQYAN